MAGKSIKTDIGEKVAMENRKIMDIIAYYLSEFDDKAFETLGFTSQAKGFEKIASLFDKGGNYLRRLRDEYDVVTSSSRRGQCNRPPRVRIISTSEYLRQFSFEELTEIVKALVENTQNNNTEEALDDSSSEIYKEVSEEDLERALNARDPAASISVRVGTNKIRIYKTAIISQLKRLYKGHCQLCGTVPFENFKAIDICEAHHIDYFASSHNNDASNIIIVCPNHHRLIHKLNPVFNPDDRCFEYPDGTKEKIKIDYICR